jgi:hypothetical protein
MGRDINGYLPAHVNRKQQKGIDRPARPDRFLTRLVQPFSFLRPISRDIDRFVAAVEQDLNNLSSTSSSL